MNLVRKIHLRKLKLFEAPHIDKKILIPYSNIYKKSELRFLKDFKSPSLIENSALFNFFTIYTPNNYLIIFPNF